MPITEPNSEWKFTDSNMKDGYWGYVPVEFTCRRCRSLFYMDKFPFSGEFATCTTCGTVYQTSWRCGETETNINPCYAHLEKIAKEGNPYYASNNQY